MKKLIFFVLIVVFFGSLYLGYTTSKAGINPLGKFIDLVGRNHSDNSNTNTPIASAIPAVNSPRPTKAPASPEPQISKLTTLSFVGDILLDSGVGRLIDSNGPGYLMSGVKSLLSSADISMANIENPISTKGAPEKDKQFTFRAKPESVATLTSAGIDIVSLANNHILDFGTDAMLETLDILDKNSVYHAGAGLDVDSASKPCYISKNGSTFAFIASSHVIPFTTWAAGYNKAGVATTYDPSRVKAEIANAAKIADIVVVYLHWGEEMKTYPVSYQKNLARIYIDAGADIVIGSHPHVLEGLEFYKGKLIAYSLGNFVFTNTTKDTMILNVELIDNKISKVKVIPCQIVNYRPNPVKAGSKFKQILDDLEAISFNVSIDSNGVVTSIDN